MGGRRLLERVATRGDAIAALSVIVGILLWIAQPGIALLGMVANGLSIVSGGSGILWFLIHVWVFIFVDHDVRAELGASRGGDHVFVSISNGSPFPVVIEKVHLTHHPGVVDPVIPDDAVVSTLSGLMLSGKTIDLGRALRGSFEVHETIIEYRNGLLGAETGLTDITLELTPPSEEQGRIIPVLYIEVYPAVRPEDLPFIPHWSVISRAYGTIPLPSVRVEYEGTMPDFWDRRPPEPID